MSEADSVLLDKLLRDFPYFQTAHLLYAKSLHNQNSIQYNNQLKLTAAYAADRRVLHRLITKQIEPGILEEVQPVVTIAEEKQVEEVVEAMIREEIAEKNIEPVIVENPIPDMKIEIVEIPPIVEAEERDRKSTRM